MAKKKATKKVKAVPKKKAATKKVKPTKKKKAVKRAGAVVKKTSTRASAKKPATRRLNSGVTNGADINAEEANAAFDNPHHGHADVGLHAGDAPDEEGHLETHSPDSDLEDLGL